MTPETYIQGVLQTESTNMDLLKKRLQDEKTIRLLHAAFGLVTEAGEFLDALKKHIFYGAALDEINLIEELGDSQWYTAVAIDALNTTFEDVWKINNAKLLGKKGKKGRYSEKFSEGRAVKRDLEAEREILEGKEKTDDFRDHMRVGPPFVSYEEGLAIVNKGKTE